MPFSIRVRTRTIDNEIIALVLAKTGSLERDKVADQDLLLVFVPPHERHVLPHERVLAQMRVDLAELADDAERREGVRVAEHGCRACELPWERVARVEP